MILRFEETPIRSYLILTNTMSCLMFVYCSCYPYSSFPITMTPSIVRTGPMNEILTCQLKLTNSSERKVVFKVKTTAPKRYCVRPNNGIVDGKSTTTILVMLQPADWDTGAADKSKHKFMVQTAYAPVDTDSIDLDSIWKTTPSESITDFKLKCVFDHTSSTAVSSPPTSNTPPSNLKGFNHEASPAKSDTSSWTGSQTDQDNLSQLNVSSSHVTSSFGDTDVQKDKILDENKKLKAEVKKLRQDNLQLKEDQVRQRTRSSGTPSSATDLRTQQKLSGHDASLASPQDIIQLLTNQNVLAIGIVLFFVGLIVGKVLL